jgi:hypothetical protein
VPVAMSLSHRDEEVIVIREHDQLITLSDRQRIGRLLYGPDAPACDPRISDVKVNAVLMILEADDDEIEIERETAVIGPEEVAAMKGP